MSSNNDIINNGVIDYGICCDECGYEIEDGVTGYWRDNVSGAWIDVRYCGICVWDFVKQPKRVTAEQIWRRQDEARKEQERLRVPESERRRIREEREERERRSQREYEEEMEEREAERKKEQEEQEEKYRAWREADRQEAEREEEEEARRKKNAALWNILAKQEVARLQKKEQEKEQECMEEEDYDCEDPFLEDSFLEELKEQSEEVMDRLREEEDRIACEQDPYDPYDFLQSEEIDQSFSRRAIEEEERCSRNDWIQAYANKFWSPPPITVSRDGKLSRSYDWDPKYDWTPCERRACCEILDEEDLFDREILDREILDREILDREILDGEILDEDLIHEDIPPKNDIPPIYQDFVKTIPEASNFRKDIPPIYQDFVKTIDIPPIYQDFVKTIPLDAINAIQQLKPKNLEVLSDYANLCEIDLIDAYHYKSRCHLYNCNNPLDPDYWDAEQNVQFCCRRHHEYFEECDHVVDIDCKVCHSRPHQNYLPHTKNLVSYRALKQSKQGFGPIVSAIRVFDELCMSNILFDSLVDLCEFY
jgi:hypothetical protein